MLCSVRRTVKNRESTSLRPAANGQASFSVRSAELYSLILNLQEFFLKQKEAIRGRPALIGLEPGVAARTALILTLGQPQSTIVLDMVVAAHVAPTPDRTPRPSVPHA